jgi:hypothetical protein
VTTGEGKAPLLWWFIKNDEFQLDILDWCLVLVLATLATLPWLQKIRWSKRFTTRTLLIATTLVAVVLGVVVWTLRG